MKQIACGSAPRASRLFTTSATALLLVWISAIFSFAASPTANSVDATYQGRVFTEIARHRQSVLQRVRSGFFPQSLSPSASQDVGNVAVLTDDGTLVTTANAFDLDSKQLTFRPAAGIYTVQAAAGGFDANLAQGTLLNPGPATNPDNIGDDGSRQISLPFPFPFFGATYGSIFINSDGNLTFGAGDAASTARSLGRMLGGAPRISPFFDDLDATAGGQLTYLSSSNRFVVTWNQVPDWAESGVGPRETFQVVLTPDGAIQFSYSGIHGPSAVVGISPGNATDAPPAVDLSTTNGQGFAGTIAEVFTLTTTLDLVGVAQKFYQTHEDAYQYLMIFTTFDFDIGNAFAFEVNIANQATGIGNIGSPPTFDFANEFGSARLESMLNMGNLAHYPPNPATVFLRGVDSTLSIIGQESGHRFLAYVPYVDPETGGTSTGLLGRDLQHWSFFFNSDASVMEGNRIRDNGNGTFTAVGAVEHYSDLDQYLMGFRGQEEVARTFVVKNPGASFGPGTSPAPPSLNFTFTGRRADVGVESIIAANGPRLPNYVTARKRYNYAFILVSPRGTTASPTDVAHVDAIRAAWEPFYAQAVSFRASANTSLVRSLQIRPNSIGLISGARQSATVEIASSTASDLAIQLSNSNPAAVSVPPQVVIPAGSRTATFALAALNAGATPADGRAVISATATGFETASLVAQVGGASGSNLILSISGGNNQVGAPGAALPLPLSVSLADSNQIVYPGTPINFSVVSGDALLSAATVNTSERGDAVVQVQLGASTGPVKIRASVPGTPLFVDFSLTSLGAPQVSQNGVVNGASFAPVGNAMPLVSPGSIISIFGTNLAPGIATAQAIPLPPSLLGTSVTIGNTAMPLFYASPTQVNAQVPTGLLTALLTLTPTYPLKVHTAAGDALAVNVGSIAAAPGIFTLDSSGSGPGAIRHNATGALVTPQNPALPGEFVQIFVTGLGTVSPTVGSGQAAPSQPPSQTNLTVMVSMNGVNAPVNFSGLAPGFVGLYQVNAQVPQIASGTAQVTVSVNGVQSPPVTMAVGSP